MRRFFQSASIGGPQFAAAALLGVYLVQCLWLVRVQTLHPSGRDADQALRIYMGLQQWKGGATAGTPESLRLEAATGVPSAARSGHLRVRDGYDQDRSPLYYLIAAAPFLVRPAGWTAGLPLWHVLASAPYLFFGVMLGGSLWYVARRLYGNAGGYIALVLYCFSPAMIVAAHTLYAPREVVLWNWRRILLLGLSLALAGGNQFSLSVLALAALMLMLWVAPVRRRAVIAIWGASCGVAIAIVFASYFFHPALFWQGMQHARWLDFDPRALASSVAYRHSLQTIFLGSPPMTLALPVTLVAFAAWKRTRYFG